MVEDKESATSAFSGAVHVDAAWALDGKPLAESRCWLALAQHQGDDRQRLFMWDGERLGVLTDEAAIELLSGNDRIVLVAMLRRLKNAGGAALALQFHIECLESAGQSVYGHRPDVLPDFAVGTGTQAETPQAVDLKRKLAANLAGLNAVAGGFLPAMPLTADALHLPQQQMRHPEQLSASRSAQKVDASAMAQGEETRTAAFHFRDGGYRLEANTGNEMVARSLVRIAHARGWYSLRVVGDIAFRRAVWLEASAYGMQVWGYAPTPEDIATLHNSRIGAAEEYGIGLDGQER